MPKQTKKSILYQELKELYKNNNEYFPYKWNEKGLSANKILDILNNFRNRSNNKRGGVENNDNEVSITLDLENIFQYNNIPITEGTVEDIKREINKFISTVNLPPGDILVQVGVSKRSNEDKSALSTRFKNESLHNLTDELFSLIDKKIEEYDYEFMPPVTMYANEFFIKYRDIQYIKKSRISESIANDKWLIIDTVTKENCLFIALEVCKKWRKNERYIKDPEYRIEKGKKLKNRSIIKDITMENLSNFAQEHLVNIIVYNNIYEKINYSGQEFLDKYETVEIQISEGHAKAMIRRKELSNYPEINTEEIIKETKRTFIKGSSKAKNHNTYFGTWDIETFSKNSIVYGIGLYIPDINTEVLQWYGKSCINDFLNYLINLKTKKILNLYAHNGGKFDIKCILNDILKLKEYLHVHNIIYQDNSITLLHIKSNNGEILFKDSFRLFSCSLHKLCESFNIKNKKTVFNHDKIKDYIIDEEILNESKEYNKLDCTSLYECLLIFSTFIYDKYNINITKTLSASGLSKKIFTTNYLKENTICLLDKKEDKFIREGYYGGRTECFKIGIFEGPLYYYDFTSLYPYVGTLNMLPVGEPIEISNITIEEIIKDTSYVYFLNCKVTKNYDGIPLLGIKRKSKYIFPDLINPTEIKALFSSEIIYAHKLGYIIQPIKGYKFLRGSPLKDFYTDLFKNKSESQGSIKNMWKIIINSGYGFFGLRTSNKKSLKISDSILEEYKKYLLDGKLINYKNESGYNIMYIEDDITSRVVNVAIASAITSLARCRLYSTINKVTKEGGIVYYCDTDSIVCNLILESIMEIGSGLGQLKNELQPNNFIDEFIVTGPKSYAMILKNLCLCKLKGCNSSNEEKLNILKSMVFKYFNVPCELSNKSNQISFRSSISCILRESGKSNPVIESIIKSYNINYNKGTIVKYDYCKAVVVPLIL
jgi:hypothetical protein